MIQKETSEKYDLKKYEKKLESINAGVFPLKMSSEGKPTKAERGKDKQPASPSIFKQKHSLSVPWLRPVEAEYLRRKVQQIHRKNTDSEKDLQVRLGTRRQKCLPLGLNAKLSYKPVKQGRIVVSDQDIDQIKRVIANGSKRSSLAYLMHEDCLLPVIKAIH
jgi:hypothetical protein